MIDWRDQTHSNRIVVEQVDPNDLDFVRDELTGVVLNKTSTTPGYYTDTRVSGTIGVFDSNYIEGSMLRIHHYVDEWEYHKEMGTFFVTSPKLQYEHGVWSGTHELKSVLYGLQEEEWPYNYAISKGRYTKEVLDEIFTLSHRQYSILSGVNDTKYSSNVVYKITSNKLTSVFEVCDKSAGRLDVNGHGVIVVDPRISPKYIAPSWDYDFDAKDSMICGPVSLTNSKSDVPGRVIISHSSGDKEISAYADAPASSFASFARRGYLKTESHSLSDMNPQTKVQASQLSKEYLERALVESDEYEFISAYVPLDQGNTVNFTLAGVKRKCLVKNIDQSYGPLMLMGLTLKVV